MKDQTDFMEPQAFVPFARALFQASRKSFLPGQPALTVNMGRTPEDSQRWRYFKNDDCPINYVASNQPRFLGAVK